MSAQDNTASSKILLVDDDSQALETTSDLLEMQGFPVLTARNGREALDKIEDHKDISLILLDLWMPVMDGREFLRRQKSDPAIATVPVIVLSGSAPPALDGADTVLRKPIDPGLLIDTVRQYCCEID
jgi:CheY-like chemotaxis protein